jgi:hypothetical protein
LARYYYDGGFLVGTGNWMRCSALEFSETARYAEIYVNRVTSGDITGIKERAICVILSVQLTPEIPY